MRVTLKIKENRVPFFMELVKSLDYVDVIEENKVNSKEASIKHLLKSFKEVKAHIKGETKLKTANEFIDVL